jgi:hypothetical protein
MDPKEIGKYYEDFKKFLFRNESLKPWIEKTKSWNLSLAPMNFLYSLVESSNNRNDFHSQCFGKPVKITYEDRKLICIVWTLSTLLSGKKPRIFYVPVTFCLSSLLFWRELYNPNLKLR